MNCNPNFVGKCFQGGHTLIKKTNRTRVQKIGLNTLTLFVSKYGTSKSGALGV